MEKNLQFVFFLRSADGFGSNFQQFQSRNIGPFKFSTPFQKTHRLSVVTSTTFTAYSVILNVKQSQNFVKQKITTIWDSWGT